jgi:hypothetical protein
MPIDTVAPHYNPQLSLSLRMITDKNKNRLLSYRKYV